MKILLYILSTTIALTTGMSIVQAQNSASSHSPSSHSASSHSASSHIEPHSEPSPHTSSVDPIVQVLLNFGHHFNVNANSLEGILRPTYQAGGQRTPWLRLVAMARSANLPVERRRLSLRKLQQQQGVTVLHLRHPDQIAIAQCFGYKETLLWQDGHTRLVKNNELLKRYSGEALVWSESKRASLKVDDPIRHLRVTTVGGTSELVETIALHNTGAKPLTVSVASTSCGCTGATLTPNVIPPGGSSVLTAKMHAIDNRLVKVNLSSDDPARPLAIVALQSQIPQGVRPPATIILAAQKGQVAKSSAIIQLPLGTTIVGTSTHKPWLQATFAPIQSTTSTPPQATYRVEATLTADAPAGRLRGQIVLQLQRSPIKQLIVPVEGYVSNDVIVTPAVISLGKVPRGSRVRKTVVVRAPADQEFAIRSIRGSSPQVTSQVDPSIVATAHAVEVYVDITGEVGAWLQERATLAFSDGRTLDVDILGIVTEAESQMTNAQMLLVGQPAPDFSVVDTSGATRRLTDLKGRKNLLLTFFPQCFTGGCAGQLASLQRELPNFNRSETEVWAVSVDAADTQKAFAAKLGLQLPLLTDTDRQLSMLYNAAHDKTDLAARQSVLIDRAGIVRWIDTNVNVQTHGADMLVKMRELNMIAP